MNAPAIYGWEWDRNESGRHPRFNIEPDIVVIERLVRRYLNIPQSLSCEVTFHAEGAFNKIYKMVIDSFVYIFRVGIPLEAPFKVLSEVATSEYLRTNTSMPIPRIFAYDASIDNEIRFPWVLMQYIEGMTLRDRFEDISLDAKFALTRQIARHHAEIFRLRFEGIGSLYQMSNTQNNAPNSLVRAAGLGMIMAFLGVEWSLALSGCFLIIICIHIRRAVDKPVIPGRLTHNACPDTSPQVSHGPYNTSRDWVCSRLSFARARQHRLLKNGDTDSNDAKMMLIFIQRIANLLDTVFPDDGLRQPTPTIIRIHDMNSRNIMVNEQGSLTGLLDWEFISTAPIPVACHLPRFLTSDRPDLSQAPHKSWYPRDWKPLPDGTYERLPRGPRNGIYHDEMEQWETSLMRDVFVEEMHRLEPQWWVEYKGRALLGNYLELVESAELGFMSHYKMNGWLDMVERGEWREGFMDEV